jgi:hypothetical protein
MRSYEVIAQNEGKIVLLTFLQWRKKTHLSNSPHKVISIKNSTHREIFSIYFKKKTKLCGLGLPAFADRGCHVVSVTDPFGRVLGTLDRSI